MVFSDFFQTPAAVVAASASGRLDVLGGIADYSGALVLQMPIDQKTTVRIALRNDAQIRIFSTHESAVFKTDTAIFLKYLDYQILGEAVRKLPNGDWASYVLGCYAILVLERKVALVGLDFFVDSDIPVGKGLSSSAALEVATLKALQQLFDLTFEGTQLPTLAQRVENQFVGAPCGLMDQLACYFGKPNHLLPIVCQPDLVQSPVAIPQGVQLYSIDSGVRHAVGGAPYGEVRTAAFMGKTIINQTCHGVDYLCNISPETFENQHAMLLPARILGADFLQQYGSINDPVSVVCPHTIYQVRVCTQHPIYENRRVKLFLERLQKLDEERLAKDKSYRQTQLAALGSLMYAAHASYSACGLGHPKTDAIVQHVREASVDAGQYGAKITGGGSGGTVCVLAYQVPPTFW